MCFTSNSHAWNTPMGVLKSHAILCNALVNYAQSANCNIISEPHKKTVCALRLKVWIECWSYSIHLPREHLELQCEQKMKRCHHPHLQQIGCPHLPWRRQITAKKVIVWSMWQVSRSHLLLGMWVHNRLEIIGWKQKWKATPTCSSVICMYNTRK